MYLMKSTSMPRSLQQKSLRDLLVALVGDPVKSKIVEKTNKFLKQMQPDQKPSTPQGWKRFNANQFGNPGNPRRAGGILDPRRSAPYPNRHTRPAVCYFCGSSVHLLRNCNAFQSVKSDHSHNKPQ